MKHLLLAALLVAITSCGTYSHRRPILVHFVVENGTTNTVVAYETTHLRLLLQRFSGSEIKARVYDSGYSRDLSIGKVTARGDSELTKSITEGAVSGAVPSIPGL